MKKITKIFLIIGGSLFLCGGLIFAIAMSSVHWDFTKIESRIDVNEEVSEESTVTYNITDSFSNIEVDTDVYSINILPSTSDACEVVVNDYKDTTKTKYIKDISVSNNTLHVSLKQKHSYIVRVSLFSISVNGIPYNASATIYLPQKEYESLKYKGETGKVDLSSELKFKSANIELSTGSIVSNAKVINSFYGKTNTGSINLNNLSSSSIELKTNTGRITLSSIICSGDIEIESDTGAARLTDVKVGKDISVETDTGSVKLSNVIVDNKMELDTDTGSVELDKCDALEMYIETSTGSVNGTVLTPKIFFADSDTGSVNVPKSMTGGRCEIKTNTGRITMEIVD